MTAQIEDIYKYNNSNYHIVALSAGKLFDPKKYGLEPHSRSTACYRGHWCEYAVIDEELLLKDLYLFNKDDKYPPLNGVDISPPEFNEFECRERKRKIKKLVPAHFGHRVYRDVNLLLPYTGRVLLGKDFMREYYVHMGFQQGWAYKELLELVFDEGLLMESNDLSHIAKAQREKMRQENMDPRYPDDGDVPKFVEESFSLDYSEKVWWTNR